MNKLFLIGNGFDKAHKLPTSYNDFINDFWKRLDANYSDSFVKQFVYVNPIFDEFFKFGESEEIKDFTSLWKKLEGYAKHDKHRTTPNVFKVESGNIVGGNRITIFEFRNSFFRRLSRISGLQTWVDIEREYYINLKEIVNIQDSALREDKILKLNEDFKQIKTLLNEYLKREMGVVNFNIDLSKGPHSEMFEILKPFIYLDNPVNKTDLEGFKLEFSDVNEKNVIGNYHSLDSPTIFSTYYLSFNYTPTLKKYVEQLNRNFQIPNKPKTNFIHNEIDLNIIFGYGNEKDEDYKRIESLDDKRFLENFKSFSYSNYMNYHQLLDYIESDRFQVIVLGHSCGLSDSVLLKTIFEHDNCKSIKVFYYEKQQEDSVEDNYTSIIQNISRHFDDKESMRKKIVNKTLCSKIPQNLSFPKK